MKKNVILSTENTHNYHRGGVYSLNGYNDLKYTTMRKGLLYFTVAATGMRMKYNQKTQVLTQIN